MAREETKAPAGVLHCRFSPVVLEYIYMTTVWAKAQPVREQPFRISTLVTTEAPALALKNLHWMVQSPKAYVLAQPVRSVWCAVSAISRIAWLMQSVTHRNVPVRMLLWNNQRGGL